jgi:hypothetical protein
MKCKGFSRPCGKYKAVKYRMLTRYVETERNYEILCPVCQEESDRYWKEQWKEYWGMVF